ncbi:MAG: 50S ribosomal protein L30 [SAR86 cluster bacterium]|jgi:large subunit ribosomal protein L30|nr:50S ribosomal protein L30 [SAR86 cluster bacterium]|tara:strand:+ start:1598 stop:1774 length:177 start_codon:yes stop_codon:yes gene_type:complete
MAKEISIKLTKSLIGSKGVHRKSVHGLGLSKVGQVVTVKDTPENRGMINKAHHLVTLI